MKHQFNVLFIATAVALFSHAASADPDQYQHRNGTVVVDINKANSNGLSHNLWKEFNVSKNGMILNNSTTDILRDTGNIAKNNNLDSAAKIILNEVITNKASSLQGFIEVAGQKADVIIANPNGITCSGCSFINTDRATLTTGTPLINAEGALTGFNVDKGSIKVGAEGLNNTSFTELLANTIQLEGKVNSNSVYAIAGNYRFDRETGKIEAGKEAKNASIDVQSLGGITADTIFLATTQAGAGVNNKGLLNGHVIQINSSGKLVNTGTISSMIGTSVNASDNIENKAEGKIESMNMINLATTKDVVNEGTLASQFGTIGLYAIPAAPDKNNLLGSIFDTLFGWSGNITNRGTIKTGGNIEMLSNNSITLASGSIEAGKSLTLLTGGAATNGGAISANNVDLLAANLNNSGTIRASQDMNISAQNGIRNVGMLESTNLTLATQGTIVNEECGWFSCNTGTLKAEKLTIKAPQVTSINKVNGNINARHIVLNPIEEIVADAE
ncbi:filamentous hemagglutinin N-terminal domain-containing protein [Erwinia sp. 9145]|uniref:filamentous hemagglutinin N-terminal domain-containing protein n=1 Tax=Erwinia sp. 9145 TaxID=1500895 RepID=UPI000555ED00|nr:filamentous hemagglutinin N-terminal domain-containing protein [Erwinia sp. 9145]